MKEIKLKDLKSRVFERSEVDEEKLRELVESVEQVGIAQPVLVRPTKKGYELIVGGRRVEATKKAGIDKIPAVIRDISDREALEFVLVENIHREDLSDVDKGRVCRLLLKRYPEKYPSQAKLAERLGMDQSTINRWIGLTEMPPEVQKMVAPVEKETKGPPKGKISSQVAQTIRGKIKEPKRQVELARAIARKRISLHKSRRIIKKVAVEKEKSVDDIIKEMRPEPELIFRSEFKKPILKGTKTQTSRPTYPQVKGGNEVWAHFTEPKAFKLKVTDVYKKKLGEFDEENAKREGGYTLDEFKRIWGQLYDEPWNPDKTVYVVRFEKANK